jgi:2-C-methyl-D-erythritol 4-phosphate cytidylyltransferase
MDAQEVKRGVVVVAGGSGTRMGGDLPKQFKSLAGKPVLVHTLERFLNFDPEISLVVVLSPSHQQYWEEVMESTTLLRKIQVAPGGRTRFESVRNGISRMREVDIIGIHDAVRPLVSVQTLEKCFHSASLTGSGIPVTAIEETIRIIDSEGHSKHLDRGMLRRVQTPQVFRAKEIRNAYDHPYDPAFTDDASVYESCFGEVTLVAGNPENIKITTPIDLLLASLLIDLPLGS